MRLKRKKKVTCPDIIEVIAINTWWGRIENRGSICLYLNAVLSLICLTLATNKRFPLAMLKLSQHAKPTNINVPSLIGVHNVQITRFTWYLNVLVFICLSCFRCFRQNYLGIEHYKGKECNIYISTDVATKVFIFLWWIDYDIPSKTKTKFHYHVYSLFILLFSFDEMVQA